GKRETVYRYVGPAGSLNLGTQNFLNGALWVEAPDYSTADRFGSSVAIGGGHIVVGMPGFNQTNASGSTIIRADVGAMRTYSSDMALPTGDSAMWAETLKDPHNDGQPWDAASLFGSVTHYDPSSRMLFVADPGVRIDTTTGQLKHGPAVYVYVNEGLYWRPVQTIESPDSVYITAAGLTTRYYDIAERSSLPNFGGLTPISFATPNEFAVYKGITGGSFAQIAQNSPVNPPTQPPTESDTFAARWTGDIVSTIGQSVTFSLGSDDGSKLFIDGALTPLINNDGLHGFQTVSGTIFLTAGQHSIEVQFFEKYGGAGIRLDYRGV